MKVNIENVNEFNFRGVNQCSMLIKPCLKDLGSKASRALFAVNSRYKLHKLPVHIALNFLIVSLYQFFYMDVKSGVHMTIITL